MRRLANAILGASALLVQLGAIAGEFGTPAACAAVGGEFRWGPGYSSWQGRCYIVTTVNDCVAKGGGRTSRPDGKVDCGLPIDLTDLNALCEAAGGSWGRHQWADRKARVEYCHIERFVSDCQARGGSWEVRGMSGVPGCVLPTKDGGKECTNRSDCETACLYVGRPPPQGAQVVGQCARDNSPYGCRSFVEGGKFVPGPCVD